MTQQTYNYDVRCSSCFEKFTVQLFDNHDKNLWLVDNKNWYCEPCKKRYFEKQRVEMAEINAEKGFPELTDTPKRISWAEKIRTELINKVDFLRQSLVFTDDSQKKTSDQAFQLFLREWQQESKAKWWIDRRNTTVRDISKRINEITKDLLK